MWSGSLSEIQPRASLLHSRLLPLPWKMLPFDLPHVLFSLAHLFLPCAYNLNSTHIHPSTHTHPFLIHNKGYIGEFEIIDDHRSNKIVVELTGRVNKCGVISPRFDVPYTDIEKWVVNLLPSRQFGMILLSTTYGIMTHEEARRKKTGGKILGFFY